MRIDLPACRHSEMKNFCKWYSDGNCKLNIENYKAPCEKYIDLILREVGRMKVWCNSMIGKDGKSYSIICAKEPGVNSHDLYVGGVMYSFHFDFNKNTTELYKYHYMNGVPAGFDKCLKKWKDEILTENECLEYVEMLEKEVEE